MKRPKAKATLFRQAVPTNQSEQIEDYDSEDEEEKEILEEQQLRQQKIEEEVKSVPDTKQIDTSVKQPEISVEEAKSPGLDRRLSAGPVLISFIQTLFDSKVKRYQEEQLRREREEEEARQVEAIAKRLLEEEEEAKRNQPYELTTQNDEFTPIDATGNTMQDAFRRMLERRMLE